MDRSEISILKIKAYRLRRALKQDMDRKGVPVDIKGEYQLLLDELMVEDLASLAQNIWFVELNRSEVGI